MANYLGYPFDAELFSYNWQNEKDLTLTNIMSSGAVIENAELTALLASGGDLFTLPFYKVLNGAPGNYDGATDVPVTDPQGGAQSGIVYGRTQGWRERDFVVDYNSGAEPMKQVTSQVAKFWDKQRQSILLAILKGVFGVTGNDDWDKHKVSVVSSSAGTVGEANKLNATSINDAAIDALGDNAEAMSLAIMHSRVAGNLANLNLLNYWKYTDANGIERKLRIGDINGMTVIINDNVPYQSEAKAAVAGIHTVKVGGTITASDEYTIAGVAISLTTGDTTPAKAAAKIAAGTYTNYSVTASSDTVTFTEKSGKEGTGAPVCDAGSTGATFNVQTTKEGAAVRNAEYTTYLLGLGSIHYGKAPVKVPSEIDRDAVRNGGEDVLVTRVREALHPNGFTFSKPAGYVASPTNADFETAGNWSIVGDTKGITLAKLVSNG